jgi:hypothetical protein
MKQMAERMWVMVIDLIAGLYIVDLITSKMQENLAFLHNIFRRLMR